MGFKISGVGSYLPGAAISNSELQLRNTTIDAAWIESRTGIKQRFFAAPLEYTSHLAYQASLIAIADAEIKSQDIDLVIVCTTTPDNSFPSTATKLQGMLGLNNKPSFDLQAVCAGFVYGLEVASCMLASGNYQTILLVGAERMSSVLDFSNRSTCILFGDGAGAVILQKDDSSSGLIASRLFSEGSLWELLYTDGGVATNGNCGKVQMRGQEVFRHAVEKMADSMKNLLEDIAIKLEDVRYIIPHQANLRIMESITNRLNVDPEKVIKTIDQHANCSAASIPLALSVLKQQQTLKTGDLILLSALGAGLTWGSALLRW